VDLWQSSTPLDTPRRTGLLTVQPTLSGRRHPGPEAGRGRAARQEGAQLPAHRRPEERHRERPLSHIRSGHWDTKVVSWGLHWNLGVYGYRRNIFAVLNIPINETKSIIYC
jgi:hypothetical protein